jgi:glycine/D-amino acid oxidase-like deaminating enzyme
MVGWKLPLTAMRRYEHRFETPTKIEPLPYVKDVNRLAFRPEGAGYSGGVPDTTEPRGVNFDIDRGYFQRVVAPALKHRFPAFENVRETDVWSGLYDMNDLDGNPIIDRWDGGLENYYVISGFSGHGLMHAPASARGLVELMLHGGYRTIDLATFGWDRVRKGVPFSETGIK